jgi:hypothetical protein
MLVVALLVSLHFLNDSMRITDAALQLHDNLSDLVNLRNTIC